MNPFINWLKKPKKGLYSKIIVVAIIIANIKFTEIMIDVYKNVKAEPTTLIVSWFGFTTGELWAMAQIKKSESKNSGGDDNG